MRARCWKRWSYLSGKRTVQEICHLLSQFPPEQTERPYRSVPLPGEPAYASPFWKFLSHVGRNHLAPWAAVIPASILLRAVQGLRGRWADSCQCGPLPWGHNDQSFHPYTFFFCLSLWRPGSTNMQLWIVFSLSSGLKNVARYILLSMWITVQNFINCLFMSFFGYVLVTHGHYIWNVVLC